MGNIDILLKIKKLIKKTKAVKGISMLYNKKELKGIREYAIKSFALYHNYYHLVY